MHINKYNISNDNNGSFTIVASSWSTEEETGVGIMYLL